MEEASKVLTAFGIPQDDYFFEPLNQGLINQTFAVSVAQEKRYVLQKINQEVFPNAKALEKNLELVLPSLQAEDYARVEFLRTPQGDLFHRTEKGELWRLMNYLPNSSTYHNTSDRMVAFEAGRILGVFHRLVASIDPEALAIPLERFHVLDWRVEQYEASLAKASKNDLSRTEEIREFITGALLRLNAFPSLELPVRVCHNDSKLNNILFTRNKKAQCLIDLDTLMPGFFAYDFGDALRTIANPAPEEETNLGRIQFSIEMLRAFAEGLALNKFILRPDEIDGLAMSIAYMPFLHGLRAFTDFLLGNRYYKVTYPDGNLDRAKSLFHFSKLALEKQGQIEDVINECLT